MPSRVIRDGLLDSELVHQAGEMAFNLFVRLMLVADDHGRFDGRLSVIARRCWPMGGPDDRDIFNRLIKLLELGLVVSYEVDHKPFIFIPNFGQRLRQKREKYPAPPEYPPNGYPQLADKALSMCGQVADMVRPEVEVDSDSESEAQRKSAPLPVDNCRTVEHGTAEDASETEQHVDVPRETAPRNSGSLAPPGPETKIEAQEDTPAGMLAAVLRVNDIVANAFHPLVVEWAREGTTVDQLRTSIATARQRKPKPERIPLAYLDPILADIRAGTMRKAPAAWRTDDNAAEVFARELGIRGAKIGEDRTAFHKRIEQALADRGRRDVA